MWQVPGKPSGQTNFLNSFQGIAYLVKISEGDLRKAITFLQSATRLTGGKEVMEDIITDIAGVSTSCYVGNSWLFIIPVLKLETLP